MPIVDPFDESGIVDPFTQEQPQDQPQPVEAMSQPIVQPTPQGLTVMRDGMSPQQLAAAEELERRGKIQFGDMLKMADMSTRGAIGAVAEPAETLATGSLATIGSGFAALRTLLETGDIGQAKKVVEQFQKQFTATPQTKEGGEVLQTIAETIKPLAEPVGEFVKKSGEVAEEIGGPYAGAAVETTLRMIPEVLGLKIPKVAKIAAIQKTIGGKTRALYDELGQLYPDIKKGLDEAGISVEDIKKGLDEPLRQEEILKTGAEDIGRATKSEKKALEIAEEARPDVEILKAADELGVGERMLPSHSAQNPVYVSLEQGLKSIPGSQLAAKEKMLISELGGKADELITEFGGELDKSLLSDKFRTQSREVIEGISKKEGELFDEISDNIPRNFSVRTDNIVKMIEDQASELGGKKFLDPLEKKMLAELSQKSKPTYARLDKYRKQIGSAFKNKGPLKDADQGALKQIYKALAKDQLVFAKSQGYDDMYKAANNLTIQRKGIEEQLVKVLGKELTGSISAKGKNAILGLQKGDTKLFDDLVENIPKEVGKEARKSVFVTALNDAFVQGSRAEKSLNIPGFDDFMAGINRNKASKKRLASEIGAPAVKRLETLHKVVGGIRKAQKDAITTGRIAAVPKMFDEVDNLASKLYGVGKAASLVKGAALGAIETAINAKRTPRSVAADELLSSTKFQEMIKKKASKALDTQEKVKRADEIVKKLKEYKEWEKTIPARELRDVATVGVIGYLTAPTEKENK